MSSAILLTAVAAAAFAQSTSRMLPVAGGGAEIPVTFVRGAKPGPTLALIAGNHGYEYPPILALQQLLARLEPARMAGAVTMVHVANMPSFLERTIYFSPIDHKNLNRVYPGKRDGTISERIAWTLTREVIDKCDYLIDLHCGDGNESLRPYVYQAVTGKAQMDEAIRGLTLAFGMDHIVLDRERPSDPAASLYCSTTAITRGRPALTVESGALGGTDAESTGRIVNGVESVMRYLKMLEGAPLRVERPVYFDPAEVLVSPATGILYPLVERDRKVAKGVVLARVTDFFGRQLAEVRAPFDGVVLYIVATPPIQKGQPVAFVGAVKQK
jgi:predicted deacylase